jgi:hypothetical protein
MRNPLCFTGNIKCIIDLNLINWYDTGYATTERSYGPHEAVFD